MVYYKLVLNDKRVREDSTYPVEVRITYLRKNTTIATGIRVKKVYWDSNAQLVRKTPNFQKLNQSILEGNTQKQKNPYQSKGLKRYVWAIARLGGWKGYESKRHPGITTLWIGLKYFKAAKLGWDIHRIVSTR